MVRAARSFLALLVFSAIAVSCTDRPAPTQAATAAARRVGALTGSCFLGDVSNLVITVFGSGGPNVNSALAKLNTVQRKLADGDVVAAREHAKDLISFIQQKATQLANPSQVQALIDAIECFAGLSSDSFLVMPLDAPQTIFASNGQAGIQLPADPVSEPTLITVTMLDPSSSGVLDTKLDKYPGYVEIQQQSNVTNSLKVPVVVGVCPSASVPSDVRSRLRLGHQSAVNGFEVTPYATANFLTCASVASTASKMPGWVNRLASLVLPKPLYARMRDMSGIGGTATEFSPFGPVDTELNFSGGVGGTATEFQRAPDAPAPAAATSESAVKKSGTMKSTAETAVLLSTNPDCSSAVVGSALSPDCRPMITLTTHNGTILQNVPVTWAVGQGGGVIAQDNLAGDVGGDCGPLGATASTITSLFGRARVCWTFGAAAGTNSVIATPHTGGDVPAGVTFVPATQTFEKTATKAVATLTLSGLSQTYTGSTLSVGVTTAPADLGSISITYNGLPTQPSDAGSYAVVATLDNPSYQGSASGTLVIAKGTQAPLSITPLTTPVVYNSSVALSATGGTGFGAVTFGASGACSVSGSTLAVTSGSGTCTITATKSGGINYADISAELVVTTSPAEQGTLTITGAGTLAFNGGDLTLGTTGGSGDGLVTFTHGASAACSVTSAGVVHATAGWGTCAITATKAADANYLATTSAPATITITKATQSITFNALLGKTYGDADFAVSATASSGLDVSFAFAGNCSVAGNTVHLTGAGTCTITAQQGGSDNYQPAPSVSQQFNIAKGSQATLTISPLTAPAIYNTSMSLSTDGGTGDGAVTFAASGACGTSGNMLTISSGTGTCLISATKAGGDNYVDATASLSVAAIQAEQSPLLITGIAPVTYGATDLALGTSGGSGSGTVAFDAGASTACSVTTGGVVHALSGTGTCVITATKSADANYTARASSPTSLLVAKATQAITFGALAGKTYQDPAFTVSANASSGLSVSFAAGGSCSVSGTLVSLIGAGSCTVTAQQAGDANYLPATNVSQSFAISPASSTITWNNPANIILGTPLSSTQLNATATPSGGTFVYTPASGTILPAGTSTLSTAFTPSSTNFAGASKTVSINVRYKLVGCFSSPVYSVMPETKSYQRKGSNLQIKCQLTNVNGVGVMNATGNLLVEDIGTNGLASPTTTVSVANAFKVSTSGNYAYGLDTSPNGFISLHYYRVTAAWNDGSTSVGFFYIK